MKKNWMLSLVLAANVWSAGAQQVAPAIPRDEKIEQQVESLLQKMTLDEKIGQMCELTIDVLQDRSGGQDAKDFRLSEGLHPERTPG